MYYINSKSVMRSCKSVTTELEFPTLEMAEKKLDEIRTITSSLEKVNEQQVTKNGIRQKVFGYLEHYYISRRCTKIGLGKD